MRMARNLTSKINRAMDQLIPPIIRDSKWFMGVLIKLFAKEKSDIYMAFKDNAFWMSDEEYARCYIETRAVVVRETDLNRECIDAIRELDCGDTVLDAGCGRGFLVNLLRQRYRTTGCDVVLEDTLIGEYPDVTFVETRLETLPFDTDSFDTVICTHVLEHVLDPQQVIAELRRVAKKQLVVIVPRERPYRQTFSLHLHFFPYAFSLLFMMGRKPDAEQSCSKRGTDWFYVERYK